MGSNKYMTVGIDHGTSNSVIAVMDDDGPRIIGPTPTESVMPSVVYFNKRGVKWVGSPAREALMLRPSADGDGAQTFKPDIGRDVRYEFRASKKSFSGPELGGLVIGELLDLHQRDNGYRPKAAVITVPAMFNQAAVEGTRKAAQLAGLEHFPLLQEPVAAAIAYGFDTSDERAQWMVFDLGGGTLDVSLVIVRDGHLQVPDKGHGGDNHLGGRDFDRLLFEHVLSEIAKDHSIEKLRHDPRHETDRARLKLAIEEAKIQLSLRSSVELMIELCCDDMGNTISVDMELDRKSFEDLIAPDVERAVQVCETLLRRNSLKADDIDSVILIGGPTKTPYVKKILRERLGIPLLERIDPMVAVAQGAAIYALTQELPNGLFDDEQDERGDSEICLRLQAAAHSNLPSYHLTGMLEGFDCETQVAYMEAERSDGQWRSGREPVDEDGLFEIELTLIDQGKPCPSEFTVCAFNEQGKILARVEGVRIWYPYHTDGQENRLPASLRVGIQDKETVILLEHGANLPARGRSRFKTTKELKKGARDDVLRIPVLESVPNALGEEEDHVDCCVHVGTLVIHGDDERITRNLPSGVDVNVKLTIDASRQITVTADIPFLDEDFDEDFKATFATDGSVAPLEELQTRFEVVEQELDKVRDLNRRSPSGGVDDILRKIDDAGSEERIRQDIERSEQSGNGAHEVDVDRGHGRLAELYGTLRHLQRLQQSARVRDKLERLRGMAQQEELDRLRKIEQELDGGDDVKLDGVEKELDEIDVHMRKLPVFLTIKYLTSAGGKHMEIWKIDILNEAEKLLERIFDKGGFDSLTEADVKECKTMNQRMLDAIPEIFEWAEDVTIGDDAADNFSHLKRA